jgi:hypothetical protein
MADIRAWERKGLCLAAVGALALGSYGVCAANASAATAPSGATAFLARNVQ